jgi:ferredoxin-type protein NapH
VITDLAAWLRRRLGLKSGRAQDANARYWVLGGSLLAAALTGSLVWEWVNPVSIVQRSLIYGLGGSLSVVFAVFAYDLLIASRGWCGHLCPTGALYGLLGKTALWRVTAAKRSVCNDCMDCFAVCPEPQVIRPALKKVGQESPLILDRDCTTCGRCVDVCGKQVFHFTHRFDQRSDS